MKKFNYLFIALLASVLLVGCKGESKKSGERGPNPYLIQPEMALTQKDTVEVRQLTRQYLAFLKKRDLGSALQMLRYYDKKEIKPLPSDVLNKEATILNMFLGMKYEIDHIIFYRDDDSEVKYTVTMFEKTDPNDHRPNKASFLLRPVRYRGDWYLTLADMQSDKVKSRIKH